MEENNKTWYARNRLQIRLIQYLLYHLKRDGYNIKRVNKKKDERPVINVESTFLDEIVVKFE